MVWLLPTKTQIVQHLDTYLSDPDPIVVAHAAKVSQTNVCEQRFQMTLRHFVDSNCNFNDDEWRENPGET